MGLSTLGMRQAETPPYRSCLSIKTHTRREACFIGKQHNFHPCVHVPSMSISGDKKAHHCTTNHTTLGLMLATRDNACHAAWLSSIPHDLRIPSCWYKL